MNLPPVHVTCVIEDRDDWFSPTFSLATSLRNLGGKTASAPMEVLFLGSMDGVFSVPLAGLGVTSRIIERCPSSSPTADKVRVLEPTYLDSSAVLVALDHDVVVLRDLSAAVSLSAVRAVPAWESPLRSGRWRQLLHDVGLAPRMGHWVTPGGREELPAPCVDSGVLFIPAPMVEPLRVTWAAYIERLDAGRYDLSADELSHLDQIALALALLETALPLEVLGQEWNFRAAGRPLPSAPVRILQSEAFGTVAGAHPEQAGDYGLARDVERLKMILAARRSATPSAGPGALVAGTARLASQVVRQIGRSPSKRAGS